MRGPNDPERRAWAAGFFDAEGCITLAGKYPALSMAQVDDEPLRRFRACLGGNVNGPYDVAGRPGRFSVQPQYRYTLYARSRLIAAVHAMWPHLTAAKRAQARRALPAEELPLEAPSTPDPFERESLAWAAGFLEGDGCFMFNGSKTGWAGVSLIQTDPEPLERFRAIVGCGRIYGPRRSPFGGTRKDLWQLTATGHERLQAVAAMLWPWMGPTKRLQALDAMLRERGRRNRRCHRGHLKPPRSRPCPECTRLYWARRRGDVQEDAIAYGNNQRAPDALIAIVNA